MLTDLERFHLRKTWELANSVRSAPEQEFSPIEPTYAALLASGEQVLAQASFRAGDAQDAVAKLSSDLKPEQSANAVLFLSIEPSCSFQRLPPVTESIRKLGVKRVIVGAESPVPRQGGKGLEALSKIGLHAELADGEEARLCQLLVEDFGKVVRKGLPLLKLFLHWESAASASFPMQMAKEAPLRADAFLARYSEWMEQKKITPNCDWTLLIDEEGESFSAPASLGKGSKLVVFTKIGLKSPSHILHFPIEMRAGQLDLALVLRKAADLGFFSVLCAGDRELFQRLINAGLVDSVISEVQSVDSPAEVMAKIAAAPVEALRLTSPRLVEQKDSRLWIEAEVNIANG